MGASHVTLRCPIPCYRAVLMEVVWHRGQVSRHRAAGGLIGGGIYAPHGREHLTFGQIEPKMNVLGSLESRRDGGLSYGSRNRSDCIQVTIAACVNRTVASVFFTTSFVVFKPALDDVHGSLVCKSYSVEHGPVLLVPFLDYTSQKCTCKLRHNWCE